MRVLKTNAALLLLLAACSQARVIQVPSDYPTIQAGIDASADGDTVLVAPGTYTGDGNRDIDVRARAVTIKSEEGPQTCIIDCDGSEDDPHRGFRVSGDGVLDGFKVIHGYVKESGGGIDCSDGCIIRNCIVTKNFAEDGGGGISISDGTVVNCIIAENKAYGHGGAILASHGNPVFINCTIVRNQASGEGGGIKCGFRGTATMTNCILVGNRASHGDQILAVDTGIIIRAMALKIGNCCIQSDSCDDLSLEGCASGYASGYRGRSMIELLDGVIYAADPRFADPDNGDFRLRPDSPCIDAGTDAVSIQLPPMDLDGNPRAADGRRDGSNLPDMGAYEFPAPDQPYMWLLPPHLEFVADSGGPNPAPKTLTIQNLGLRPLNWTIRHDSDWLAVSADSGTVGSQTIEVVVTVDSSNLSPGSFACDITISDPNALNNSQAIPVALYVPKILYVPGELSTIQDAIDAANPYDTIVVADGVYEGEGNHDITFGGKPITLRSENGPGNCIIEFRPNQYNRSSVFVFDSGEDRHSILDGFTIIAGPCREIVRCDQSSPTIRNCRIAGRVDVRLGDVGAGIDLSWADAAIENCHIQYCYLAISSGASDALISDCTLQDNYLGLQLLGWSPQLYRCHASRNEREAIYLGGCRETQVVDCTMIQNGKDIWCPAMNCYGSSVVLKRCNVSGNNGGGIDFYSCPNVNVQNCVISANGNYYSTDGYGVRSVGSDILVENSTIAQNIGDGFRCEGYQTVKLPAGMTMAMKNSILWDNEPNQVGGRTDLLSLTHTNVQGGWPGVGNIDVDPLFAQPGNWDPNDTPDDPNDDFWVEGDYHLKSQAGRWDPNRGRLSFEISGR
ncbi:MAG: right-handed parallel beta-helix repeat-containing protein [Planctomycetota bacterium]